MGKIYKLKNENAILYIAVLNNNLTDGISCQSIIGCIVVNESDPKYISWKFSEINDEVNYNEDSYSIVEIISFSEKLFAEIRGNSTEEAIKEIGKWLEGRKNGQQEIFKIFNESKGIFPVTLLARQLGVDYYTTWGQIISKNELKLNNYR